MEKEKVYADGISPSEFAPVDRSKLDTDQIVRPSVSYWKSVWRRIRQDKMAIFCTVLLLVLILMAIFAPVFSPYEYDRTSLLEGNLKPSAAH